MSNQTPDPVTGEDVRGLREDTKGLTQAVDTFATKAEVKESRRLSKRANINTGLCAVALLLVALFGGLFIKANSDANAKQDRERKERSVGSCIQANVAIQKQREAMVTSLLALVPEGTVLRPDQQASIDRYRAAVAVQLPYRDCSPAGIEAFLRNPPTDPATGG